MLMSGPNGILTATIQRFTCWLEGVIKNVTKDLDCDASKLLPAAVFNGVVQFIQKWTGALPTPVVANLEQAINYTCQSFFPGQGAANALYNAGLIDEEVWTCYTKVAGNHVAPQKQIREISRTRLDPMQWTALYMRELIGKDTWQQKLHEAGVLYDNEIQAYRDIQIAQPQLDDVIRMMVRDVADKDLVERFCMDDDFPDKWVGPLKKLGEHLGVTDDLAKLYWRAHWHLPSPTQLYEMLHRLRPGRVAEEIQVTEDDVRTALKQDDLLPFWVDREMAISYSPLRLVDIRRAYMLEAIDDEELYNLTRDRGLNDADAQITVKLYQKMKEEADLKKIGAPKPAKYATMFVNRIISKEEMNEVFGELNVPEKTQQAMLHFAELDQEYKDRQETIAAIKKMFMTGLIGYDEATKRLSDDSVPGETVNKLLERWSHNITRKPKEIPAAQLCKMRSLSVITPQQQLAGLIRLNYSQDQAKQIVQLCEFELQEKQAKAMERAAAKAKADAEKAAKAQEKAAKEAAKAQQQQQPAHTNA